jgi:hypothetical protein
MARITMSTVKYFVRKHREALHINVKSRFDSMTDCIELCKGSSFELAKDTTLKNYGENNTLGIEGAWFVGSSRDYLAPYVDNQFEGIEVSNACGSFILAIQKN